MSDDMRGLYIWLDERLQQVMVAHIEAHGRIRTDMTAGFAEIRESFKDVFAQARLLNDRTLKIEVERDMERRAGIRVGVIYGSLAGAIASGLIAGLFRLLDTP